MNWNIAWGAGLLIIVALNICFGIYYNIWDNHKKATRHLLWAILLLMLRAAWLEEILITP